MHLKHRLKKRKNPVAVLHPVVSDHHFLSDLIKIQACRKRMENENSSCYSLV